MEDQQLPIRAEHYDIELNEQQAEIVRDYFEKMDKGPGPAATSTLICKGEQCEVHKHCPLAQAKAKLPYGKPCPIEAELVQRWYAKLTEELNIDQDSIVDQAQAAELVRNWVLDKRVHEVLADQKLVINSFRGTDAEGQAIFQEISHPLLYYFEKMHKVSDRVLQSLIATREAKSKDKSRQVMSAAQLAAGITSRVEQMKLERKEHERQMIIDAQGNIEQETEKRVEEIDVDVIEFN